MEAKDRVRHTEWNVVTLSIFAFLFWAYFQFAASPLIKFIAFDPLLFNFAFIPAVFGCALFFSLKGAALERLLYIVLTPVIPVLIIGQEGDAAKPGLQWLLLAAMQIPYWAGAGFAAIASK